MSVGLWKEGAECRRKRKWMKAVSAVALIGLLSGFPAFPAEAGWVSEEDGWYYYLMDGRPKTGWLEDQGRYYYLSEEGRLLSDIITPDGYYVDGSGAWYQRSAHILEVQFTSPERFAAPDAEWTGKGSLTFFKDRIGNAFSRSRSMRLTESAIEYVSTKEKTKSGTSTVLSQTDQTVLAGLYKDPAQGSYRLDLRIRLNQKSTDEQAAATYDYAVFKAMMYQISAAPELLEEAIYDAWQGENKWKINRDSWVRVGDSLVTYTSGNGYGRFFIRPVGEGNEIWMQTGSN